MKNFALIGAAGYIAPRHMKAIKETENRLVAALDKHDNVGILDSYFPDADFFTELERFDRHLDKLKRKGTRIDYVTICSPNYLHDAHIRFALKHHADAICEKPLVLNPWNLEALKEIEQETQQKVFTILQLRLHPSIIALREKIRSERADIVHDVELTYITSRGNWYNTSWKGDMPKSGGIATNIGIHFFDMLMWIFGEVQSSEVHSIDADHAAGYLQLERARVKWFLSINASHLPETIRNTGKRTYRSITIRGQEIEFSEGFTDLHTDSYRHVLSGGGFGLEDARPSIEVVHLIRNSTPTGIMDNSHQFLRVINREHDS